MVNELPQSSFFPEPVIWEIVANVAAPSDRAQQRWSKGLRS
jgi:hypothetical protein